MNSDGSRGDPLLGLRIVSIEQAVAAPLCTRHLAELGAEVIKIERVGSGDFARAYDTSVHGQGAHFVWLNHGKRSLALDLASEDGRDLLKELLLTADVLISNLGPGSVDRLIDPAELEALNPRLVHCLIDGYGDGGPYEHRKAYDLLVQGEAGVTASTGTPKDPAKPGVSLADLGAGTYALAGVMTALFDRQRTGRGTRFRVSLFDVVTEWMSPLLLTQRYGGSSPPPAGTHHASIVPYGAFEVGGGRSINLAAQNDGQWERLCRDVLGDPSLLDDERFTTNELRLAWREDVVAAVGERLAVMPYDEVVERLDRSGIPWGHLNQIEDVVEHPQLAHRERWREVHLATAGTGDTMESLASPLRDLEAAVSTTPSVPRLGQDSVEILRELGLPHHRITQLIRAGVVGASSGTDEGRP
jgi:itaconate CoA-transferase